MTGRRHALLIGAQTAGLAGVHRDLDLIQDLLSQRGFPDVTHCTGSDATYTGITEAIKHLIRATRPEDTVVVYYSGHGSRSLRPDAQQRRQRGESVYLQYLVPVDLTESTEDRFNGLLAQELSALQRALTDITPDVTTILDCCFAGGMARDVDLMPRFVQRTVPTSAAYVRLDKIGAEPPRGNEVAVRLVASEIDRPAYEGPIDDGQVGGLFTNALVRVLSELADRQVPWRRVLSRVRELLELSDGRQRPTVEGPARRYPFSREESRADDGLPVQRDDDRVRVVAGALFGLAAGDVVRLSGADDDTPLLESDVIGTDGGDAVLSAPAAAVQQLPADLVAVPIRTKARQPVFLDLPTARTRELDDAVAQSPHLQLSDRRVGALAVRRADGGLMVEDAGGASMRTGMLSADPAHAGRVVDLLELLAKGERVRRLADGTGEARLDRAVDLTYRLVTDSEDESKADVPRQIHTGDRLLITARNRGLAKVYVWLFDVGVSARVTLLSNDQPDGRPLEPADQFGDTHTFGASAGIGFFWPPDVPADGPRVETLLLVVADRQLDLSPLESRTDRPQTRPRSDLRGLLAEAVNGTREGHPVEKDVPRYLVRRVDLLLAPSPPSRRRTRIRG